MNFASKPHVSFAYVFNFIDLERRIRFEQAAAEEAFGAIVGTQSQQTNVPDDADPTHPRILFPSERKTVLISQAACQMSMNFKPSEHLLSETFRIAKKNIFAFAAQAVQFRPSSNFGSNALVVEFRFSSESRNEDMAAYLYERFIKTEPQGEPVSLQLQLGYKYEGLYLSFSCNPYETRKLPESVRANVYTRADAFPIIDRGIQIRIELNNIPDFQTTGISGAPERLFAAAQKFVEGRLNGIIGVSIV